MISTRSAGLLIDTVVCLTLAKWETVSGRFGGYLTDRSATAELYEALFLFLRDPPTSQIRPPPALRRTWQTHFPIRRTSSPVVRCGMPRCDAGAISPTWQQTNIRIFGQ